MPPPIPMLIYVFFGPLGKIKLRHIKEAGLSVERVTGHVPRKAAGVVTAYQALASLHCTIRHQFVGQAKQPSWPIPVHITASSPVTLSQGGKPRATETHTSCSIIQTGQHCLKPEDPIKNKKLIFRVWNNSTMGTALALHAASHMVP